MLCIEASQKEEADLLILDKQVEKLESLHQQEQQQQYVIRENNVIRKRKKEMNQIPQQHGASTIREQETKILEEKLQKQQLKTEQETERKLQQIEREMRNKLKIDLEEMKGKNIQPS